MKKCDIMKDYMKIIKLTSKRSDFYVRILKIGHVINLIVYSTEFEIFGNVIITSSVHINMWLYHKISSFQ